ncbi:MAG TPA: hypothetical protein VIL51_01355 [Thermoleophilia bacterium]
MSFYLQHGYGKSTKIQDIQDGSTLDGVILSPADEDQESLSSTVALCQGRGLVPLLDPQTYIYSFSPLGSGKKHASHGLDFNGIHWSIGNQEQARLIETIGKANQDIGIAGPFIAPSCLQVGFDDVWTSLAVNLARSASDRWGSDATIASVVLDESALGNWNAISDWLDVVTTLEVRGFYLVVNRRSKDYPPRTWDSVGLANLLRIIYVLAELNEYELYFGYSDIVGQLGVAVGASAACSGWHYSLRTFNQQKWQPQPPGGRAPAPRYFVDKMWTTLRVDPELDALLRLPLRDRIFSQPFIDHFDAEGLDGWSRTDAQAQQLLTLSNRCSTIAARGGPRSRVDAVAGSLGGAGRLFAEIASTGVVLPPDYRSQVVAYQRALEHLDSQESL